MFSLVVYRQQFEPFVFGAWVLRLFVVSHFFVETLHTFQKECFSILLVRVNWVRVGW